MFISVSHFHMKYLFEVYLNTSKLTLKVIVKIVGSNFRSFEHRYRHPHHHAALFEEYFGRTEVYESDSLAVLGIGHTSLVWDPDDISCRFCK